jgi:hypothetical protein
MNARPIAPRGSEIRAYSAASLPAPTPIHDAAGGPSRPPGTSIVAFIVGG